MAHRFAFDPWTRSNQNSNSNDNQNNSHSNRNNNSNNNSNSHSTSHSNSSTNRNSNSNSNRNSNTVKLDGGRCQVLAGTDDGCREVLKLGATLEHPGDSGLGLRVQKLCDGWGFA